MDIRQEKYNVTIAKRGDLKRITEILNQAIKWGNANAYSDIFTADDRVGWFNSHSDGKHIIFVASDKNKVVGFLTLSPYRKGRQAFACVAEVSYYVDFEYHRKGIASALMEHAYNHCRKVGFRTLIAFLYGHNDRSIQFLMKYGFEQWGFLPKTAFVKGETYDHVIYGKHLVTG